MSNGRAPFENKLKTRKTLQLVFPAVIAVIVLILYLTLQELDRRGADDDQRPGGRLAGGAIFQWLFGFNFSVAVWSATSPASGWRRRRAS